MPAVNRFPELTYRRAAWIAAAVAGAVYANAVLNGWAGDDPLVIAKNARVHSAGAALHSWFLSYWPPPWEGAGLYRPLTILSYGVEWSLSAGRPWLFHLDNILLHAAATVLAVGVAAAWLPALGALVAGLFFAVHPVHVEAVSNVVGRAELLAATALMAMLLAARKYRHAERSESARRWLAASLACLATGLLSKEHAVIGIAVIALDQFLDPRPARRHCWGLYPGLATVTVAWFFVWHAIAGEFVKSGETTAFYGLSTGQRIATMMAVQLDVLRLLVFPLDLAADYSQLTTELQRSWGAVPWTGLLAAGSVLALGLVLVRRVPVIAFGIQLAAGSYAPISNLFFISGVVLAERALYLAVLAPALALGWAVCRFEHRPESRTLGIALIVFLVVLAGRTVARTPYWRTAETSIIEDAGDHPENYRNRIHVAGIYITYGNAARALAEYLAAGALAENDPFVGEFTVRNAIALRRANLAVLEGRRVHEIAPHDPRTGRWLMQAYVAAGQHDSAVVNALRDALQWPAAVGLVRTYKLALEGAKAPRWRLLMVNAADDWLSGRLIQGTVRLDSLSGELDRAVRAASFCDDLALARPAIRGLRPALLTRVREAVGPGGRTCEALD